MRNYPGVWSLFSIQFTPRDFTDPTDLESAQFLFERMSKQRCNGAGVRTLELLATDRSDRNPIGHNVHLRLYRIEFDTEPELNPDFYENGRWMTFDGYELAASGEPCGLCMRMWGDVAFLKGIIGRPFLPSREAVDPN